MRSNSEVYESEVTGTTSGDQLAATAWRGGRVVAQGLKVESYNLTWDATRQVQGRARLRIPDPDGVLTPWAYGDPLGSGGTRLVLEHVSGLTRGRIPLGPWRISNPQPTEFWRPVASGGIDGWQRMGGYVEVEAAEDLLTIKKQSIIADSPKTATVVSEIRRLLEPICAVWVHPDIVDVPVPADLVYDRDLFDEVEDHVDRLKGKYRQGPDGSFEIVPNAGIGPATLIRPEAGGQLVEVSHELPDEDVSSVAVVTSTDEDGRPLMAVREIEHGELAANGPYGPVPTFVRSDSRTQAGVDEEAYKLHAELAAAGEVAITATVLAHAGRQVHDKVLIRRPTLAGLIDFPARITGMELAGSKGVPNKTMKITAAVSSEFMASVSQRVRDAV